MSHCISNKQFYIQRIPLFTLLKMEQYHFKDKEGETQVQILNLPVFLEQRKQIALHVLGNTEDGFAFLKNK